MLEPVAEALGASLDQIQLIALLVLSLPLSLLVPYISTTFAHVYIISVSVYYIAYCMGLWTGLMELVLQTLITWVVCRTSLENPSLLAKLPIRWPWLVFFLLMGWLTVNNLYVYFGDVNRDVIDISGSMMIAVMKLTLFAWDFYDGSQPLAELDKSQAVNKVQSLPPLLDFMSFSLFFPGILVGPSFRYSSFQAFIERSIFEHKHPEEKHEQQENGQNVNPSTYPTRPSKLPPGRRRKMLKKLVLGLLMLGVYATYGGGQYSYSRLQENDLKNSSYLYRVLFAQLAGFVARTKYYAVWTISEAAFIGSGLAYDPVTKKYNGSKNVDIWNIEFADNFKVLLDNWNINTNHWLREAVYKRTVVKGQKPGFKSTMATFATSSLWHGIYISYHLTFFFGGFIVTLARNVRTLVRPFILKQAGLEPDSRARAYQPGQPLLKTVYDILGTLTTQLILNYIVAPFLVFNFWDTVEIWSSLKWYGHVITLGTWMFLYVGGGKLVGNLLGTKSAPKPKQKPTQKPTQKPDNNNKDQEMSRSTSEQSDVAAEPRQGMPNAPVEELVQEVQDHIRKSQQKED